MSFADDAIGLFLQIDDTQFRKVVSKAPAEYDAIIDSIEAANRRLTRSLSRGFNAVYDSFADIESVGDRIVEIYGKVKKAVNVPLNIVFKVNDSEADDATKNISKHLLRDVGKALSKALGKATIRLTASMPLKKNSVFAEGTALRTAYEDMVQPPDYKGGFKNLPKFATGGIVTGPGVPGLNGVDNVLSLLAKGEYVIPADITDKLSTMGEKLRATSGKFIGSKDPFVQLIADYRNLTTAATRWKKLSDAGFNPEASIRYTEAMGRLEGVQKAIFDSASRLNKRSLMPLMELMEDGTDTIKDYKKELEDLAKSMKDGEDEAEDAAMKFLALNTALSNLESTWDNLRGMSQSKGTFAPVEQVESFYSNLNESNRVLQLSRAELRGFGSDLIAMSADIKTVPETVGEALESLTELGVRNRASLKAMIPVVVKMAEATNVGMDQAAQFTYVATQRFKMTSESVSDIFASLAKAQSVVNGAVSMQDVVGGTSELLQNAGFFLDKLDVKQQTAFMQNVASAMIAASSSFVDGGDVFSRMIAEASKGSANALSLFNVGSADQLQQMMTTSDGMQTLLDNAQTSIRRFLGNGSPQALEIGLENLKSIFPELELSSAQASQLISKDAHFLATSFAAVQQQAVAAGTGMDALSKSADANRTLIDRLGVAVTGLGSYIETKLGIPVVTLSGYLAELGPTGVASIAYLVNSALPMFGSLSKGLWSVVAASSKAIVNFTALGASKVAGMFMSGPPALPKIGPPPLPSVGPPALPGKAAISGIGEALGGVGKGLGGVLQGLATGLAAFANPMVIAGTAVVTAAIAALVLAVGGAIGLAGDGLKHFADAVNYVAQAVAGVAIEGIKAVRDVVMSFMDMPVSKMLAVAVTLPLLATGMLMFATTGLAMGPLMVAALPSIALAVATLSIIPWGSLAGAINKGVEAYGSIDTGKMVKAAGNAALSSLFIGAVVGSLVASAVASAVLNPVAVSDWVMTWFSEDGMFTSLVYMSQRFGETVPKIAENLSAIPTDLPTGKIVDAIGMVAALATAIVAVSTASMTGMLASGVEKVMGLFTHTATVGGDMFDRVAGLAPRLVSVVQRVSGAFSGISSDETNAAIGTAKLATDLVVSMNQLLVNIGETRIETVKQQAIDALLSMFTGKIQNVWTTIGNMLPKLRTFTQSAISTFGGLDADATKRAATNAGSAVEAAASILAITKIAGDAAAREQWDEVSGNFVSFFTGVDRKSPAQTLLDSFQGVSAFATGIAGAFGGEQLGSSVKSAAAFLLGVAGLMGSLNAVGKITVDPAAIEAAVVAVDRSMTSVLTLRGVVKTADYVVEVNGLTKAVEVTSTFYAGLASLSDTIAGAKVPDFAKSASMSASFGSIIRTFNVNADMASIDAAKTKIAAASSVLDDLSAYLDKVAKVQASASAVAVPAIPKLESPTTPVIPKTTNATATSVDAIPDQREGGTSTKPRVSGMASPVIPKLESPVPVVTPLSADDNYSAATLTSLSDREMRITGKVSASDAATHVLLTDIRELLGKLSPGNIGKPPPGFSKPTGTSASSTYLNE